MVYSKIFDTARLSFEKGIQWLCRWRSERGGWGEDQGSPTVGITGHVLLAFAELGLSSSQLFRDDLAFIGRLCRRDTSGQGTYWSGDLLQVYSQPKNTMRETLLAAFPVAQYENGFHYSGIDRNELEESVLRWGMEMTDTSQQLHASCGMWEHYQLVKVLEALSYKGDLWNRLKKSIRHKRNAEDASWPSTSEGANKETAQALQTLLRYPDIDTNEISLIVDYLFSRVIQSQDYAYWESDVGDPICGVFFHTRWVILALLEASNILSFDTKRLETLEKSVYWLASIQRQDGGWVEIIGDPLGRDEERHNRPIGPGFVAYAVLALGKWLLMNGVSLADIHSIIEGNFSATGKCFVLMPFEDKYRGVYEQVIRPTIESNEIGLQCVRVDEIKHQGNVIDDIVREICNAEVIVADLSGLNPNVFYELGVSHALTNKTVMIARDKHLPFNLGPYRVIFYKETFGGEEKLKRELAQAVLTVLRNESARSNPVQDFLKAGMSIRRPGEALRGLLLE